jgi:hypothetical protein
MAVFPDLGSWLLRSVRRDNLAGTPVLAVERLHSLPQPLQNADKEALVGAVLTMSSSLHLALGMLQELLPQEESRERLGEVLCPTLAHLFSSLQSTLCSFEWKVPVPAHGTRSPTPSPTNNTPEEHRTLKAIGLRNSPDQDRPVIAHNEPEVRETLQGGHLLGSAAKVGLVSGQARTQTRRDPPSQVDTHSHELHVEVDIRSRPENHLVKALQAERRVQAAIHVAIESLEFAEGQLKLVKQVNQLHGGGE